MNFWRIKSSKAMVKQRVGTIMAASVVAALISGCSRQAGQQVGSGNATSAVPNGNAATTQAQIDPRARQIVNQAVATYKQMGAYSSTGLFKAGATTIAGKVAWARPNRLQLLMAMPRGAVVAVSDGKTVYAKKENILGLYLKVPAPKDLQGVQDTLQNGGLPVSLTTDPVLIGSDPVAVFGDRLKSLTVGPEDVMGGVPVETVVAHLGEGGKITLTYDFGKQDHLLYRSVASWKEQNQPAGWVNTYSDIKANPTLTDAAFSFSPPPAATAVDSLVPKEYDARLSVGKNPFPFHAQDTKGQAVSLDQYKGKVVLLDFWATWCGPCVASLPDIIADYKKYHTQGFEVVGINLDESRDDLNAFLKTQQMPWRQVSTGLGWKSEVPRLYGVTAIPFILLIGRDGHIAALNVEGEDLEAAIRKALAKPGL